MAVLEGVESHDFTSLGLTNADEDHEAVIIINLRWVTLLQSRQHMFKDRFTMSGRYWPCLLAFRLVTPQTASWWTRYATLGPQRPPFRAILPLAIQEYLKAIVVPAVTFVGIEILIQQARHS
ncbi:hypothetical protein M422DRAFT_247278 [Sphaerobolus stellatus SS14]|nr:hypothetical protein M422DRAFT_247278 [Sphaerobolus stellatus SS14]